VFPETLHPGGLELTRRALEACAPGPGARLVDLGCGGGAAVQFLGNTYGVQAAGVDLRYDILREARLASPVLRLVCARAEHLPFKAESCDALLAECSLSTMCDLDRVLAECRRVLAPGGRLSIGDLYRRESAATGIIQEASRHAGPPAEAGDVPCTAPLAAIPDREGWISRLEASGFETLFWEDHTLALKIMAAQAILSGRSLDALWGCSSTGGVTTSPSAVSQFRLGYFLTVVHKI
jgi:SAM-dependent methyltransferase